MLGDLREVFFCLNVEFHQNYSGFSDAIEIRHGEVLGLYNFVRLVYRPLAIFLNLLNARWGRIFNIHLTTNLPRNLPVKKI